MNQPKPPARPGIRPEFEAIVAKFESKYGVDFTPTEEKKIAAAPNPDATAKQIARQHHSGFQSRQGGRFGSGRVGAAYYKTKGEQK